MDKRAAEQLERNRELRELTAPPAYHKREKLVVPKDKTKLCAECNLRFECLTNKKPKFTGVDCLTHKTGRTLDAWRENIMEEIPFVDVKPYSSNIINISLIAIAQGWGDKEANSLIEDYGLEEIGWHKKEIEPPASFIRKM
jgi:hypothetical protein